MNANPPKKSPATVISDPQELEHEIRLRASTPCGRRPGRRPRLDDWLHAEAESSRRRHAPSPPNTTLPNAPGPDPSGPFSCEPETCHHFNRRFEFGGVYLDSGGLSFMIRKRGNPNWGRPMLPASVLCTEFEMQVRQLQLAPETYVSRISSAAGASETEIDSTSLNGCSKPGISA